MGKPINDLLGGSFNTILDVLKDGIIITDEACNVIYINPAYTLFSGLEWGDIVGKNLADIRPGAVLPEALRLRKSLENIPRKVGTVESFCDFIPLFKEGELCGGMVVVKDGGKIKELLNQLEKTQEKLGQLEDRLRSTFVARFSFRDFIGQKGKMQDVIKMCQKAAHSNSPVLLLGESGAGKEVIAQSIHNESNRRNCPFVDINCGALPEQLLESELFGYNPGAFTGASRTGKKGLFEIANGGTVFLDEITEMPINLQTKLLRVLQEKRIIKIGGEKGIHIDVRVIAATNHNIVDLINENRFRNDLYFRLAVFVINIPPLRERNEEDIKALIEKFIAEQERQKKQGIIISPEAEKALLTYNWPGNVRELRNAIEFACSVTEDNVIKLLDLPPSILKLSKISNIIHKNASLNQIVEEVERSVLHDYLKLYGESLPSKKRIANELGISIATLYNKLKKYNLEGLN
jgi:TyrR family helix-turn-helix protein